MKENSSPENLTRNTFCSLIRNYPKQLGKNIIPGKNAELLCRYSKKVSIVGDRVSPEWKSIKSATQSAFSSKLSKSKKGQIAKEKNAFLGLEVNFMPTDTNIELFTRASWERFKHYEQLDFVYY